MAKNAIQEFDFEYMGPPAKPGDDFVFVFSEFDLKMDFSNQDADFDEDAARNALTFMSRKICIDKTYVGFKNTKYKNVFLREDGWNFLCYTICEWQAKGDKNPEDTAIAFRKAFEAMIVAYMEHVAKILGYDPRDIDFWVDPDSDIVVRVFKDVAREWRAYPGRWQTWPENN